MKRLIIVYSSKSGRFSEVDEKVIAESRKLKGWMIAKYEIKDMSVRANIAGLAKLIRKGDLVVSAGGDVVATIAMNAIIRSGEIATFGAMPFGIFNDYAETLGRLTFKQIIRKFEEGKYADFYPLNIVVDGKHYVYSGMYFMVGMMAESARVLGHPRVKKKLGRARNRMSFSARRLFRWYLKTKRRKDLLPEGTKINDMTVAKNSTDYVAMNGASLAGVIPGGVWYRSGRQFWSGTMRNRSFWRMLKKFLVALEGTLPGKESMGDAVSFKKPCDIYVQSDGRGEKLENVSKISVLKSGNSLRVIKA